MSINLSNYEIVGEIGEKIADLAKINYTGNIYAAPGVVKHIKRRHKDELSDNVLNNLIEVIKVILSSPEYIGTHPKKVGESIEFIKEIDENLLVATELDVKEGYLYIASLYPITHSKIKNRLHSGRIKKCD